MSTSIFEVHRPFKQPECQSLGIPKYLCSDLRRGHLGGMVGGALTAYLLGPNIQVIEGKGGKRQVQDNPPLPIFASKL